MVPIANLSQSQATATIGAIPGARYNLSADTTPHTDQRCIQVSAVILNDATDSTLQWSIKQKKNKIEGGFSILTSRLSLQGTDGMRYRGVSKHCYVGFYLGGPHRCCQHHRCIISPNLAEQLVFTGSRSQSRPTSSFPTDTTRLPHLPACYWLHYKPVHKSVKGEGMYKVLHVSAIKRPNRHTLVHANKNRLIYADTEKTNSTNPRQATERTDKAAMEESKD